MIGVLFDDAAHAPIVGKLFAVLAQIQGNAGAAARFGARLDRKLGLAAGLPQHAALGRRTRFARVHFDALRDDKRRVKPHAELADQLGVFLLVAGELFEKGGGARFGNRAEVIDHLVAGHADAVIGDADRARLFVHIDAHRVLAIAF